MQKYFEILGVNSNATQEEIEKAYLAKKEKLSKDRFLEGEAGNDAARQLTMLETAYYEIKLNKAKIVEGENQMYDYSEIETLIKQGNISLAQAKLDDVNQRDAEWHYLQSVIFYKKNWVNESKKQLEIALNLEPHNEKYSTAYVKLKEKIEYNDRQFANNAYGTNYQTADNRQMGGTDTNGCVDYCLTMCCMNLMCNMCCNCR